MELLARAQALPAGAVAALFRRYGKPLEMLPGEDARRVTLAAGVTLAWVRVRTAVDVIANDWFVLEGVGEAVGMPGPLLASLVGALEAALGRAG